MAVIFCLNKLIYRKKIIYNTIFPQFRAQWLQTSKETMIINRFSHSLLCVLLRHLVSLASDHILRMSCSSRGTMVRLAETCSSWWISRGRRCLWGGRLERIGIQRSCFKRSCCRGETVLEETVPFQSYSRLHLERGTGGGRALNLKVKNIKNLVWIHKTFKNWSRIGAWI